jgi:hypothetical protein
MLLGLTFLGALVYFGYHQPWTGFPATMNPAGEAVPAKNLWDWLDLLIVPLVLALAAFSLNLSTKRSDQRVERDRQRQQVFDKYLEAITAILLTKPPAQELQANARDIARTRTLTALRLLDGGRKAQLLQFLREAGLIDHEPVVLLNGADFDRALLAEANLSRCEMRGVYFRHASIRDANLVEADLRGSDFSNADLRNANLNNANLVQAIMRNADLRGATLSGARTDQVDFTNAQPKSLRSR